MTQTDKSSHVGLMEFSGLWQAGPKESKIHVPAHQAIITGSRTGCSFVTVDAPRDVVPLYEKNGFKYLGKSPVSSDSDTWLMYDDLTDTTC